jgi:hypothetical protein
MKISEFRKLIREEVAKVIKEERPLRSGMLTLLDPMIKGMYDQFDTMDVTPSIVNITISPREGAASKIYDALEKNKSSLSSFLQTNQLPNCKLFLAVQTSGFGGEPKVIITSKPKPTSAKIQKAVQI